MSAFAAARIGDLGKVKTGKTPSTKSKENFGGPYPFITIPDLDGRVYVDECERTLSEQGAQEIKSCLLPAGSILMSCIATVGRCGIAKSLRDQKDEGLTPEEAAFYAALAKNESAVEVLGNKELLDIAAQLVRVVRETSAVDWWRRDNVRAKMRAAVKKILRRHGYPPDLQDEAVRLVIRQAEAMAQEHSQAA